MKPTKVIATNRFGAAVRHCAVILLTIVATSSAALASLGQDSDKIEDAYGSIAERRLRDDGTVSVLYHKDRYLYLVIFANGRSVSETYFHVKGTDLSEKEITRFLKANASDATWATEGAGNDRRFKRSDGKAEASYTTVRGKPALVVRELRGTR
jgi:hypothetical protein